MSQFVQLFSSTRGGGGGGGGACLSLWPSAAATQPNQYRKCAFSDGLSQAPEHPVKIVGKRTNSPNFDPPSLITTSGVADGVALVVHRYWLG